MRFASTLAAIAVVAASAAAWGDAVVVPNANANVRGTSGLNTLTRNAGNPRTYQFQMSAAQVQATGLAPGMQVTGLTWRMSTTISNDPFSPTWPPTGGATWADYEITCAQATNSLAAMSTTFASNMTNPVMVRDGPLTIPAGTFSHNSALPAPTPQPWGFEVQFQTPYIYQGGDLVVLATHTGSDQLGTTAPFLDSVASDTVNARAFSQTMFQAQTGVAATFTIQRLTFDAGLTVDAIEPRTGVEGDIVRIFGRGFGNNPDNICAVVMNGPEYATPLEVLRASDTMIEARVGPIPDNVQPGQVMVGLGKGTRGPFRPAFFDIFVEDPAGTWVWDRNGGQAAMGPPFFPRPTPPPPDTRYFHGEVVDGRLCIVLDEPWMTNTYVQVWARVHNHQLHIGHDLQSFCLRFRRPGSARECALRICDVLRCAFGQQGIIINCEVGPGPTPGSAKITVTMKGPGGIPVRIDWGNFTVCRFKPRPIPGFGNLHTGFFGAEVLPGPTGEVVVGNLGRSGNDGATVEIVPARHPGGIDIELLPLQLHSLPGASLTLMAWGGAGGREVFLGEASLRGGPTPQSFFDVFADFPDIGASRARVIMHDRGAFVGQVVLRTGFLGQIRFQPGLPPPPIDSCGKRPPVRFPPFPPCYWIGWERPVIFDPGEGPPLVGDELSILAHDGNAPVDELQLFDIAAGNVPGDRFIIRREVRTVGCYPDCDQTSGPGNLDIFDFLCFQNRYAAEDPYACDCDVTTGPGICDIFDFLCFQNAYAAGCP